MLYIKFKPNGEVERYKARLIAKGYLQIKGIDFTETFPFVIIPITLKIVFTLALSHKIGSYVKLM